MFGHDSNRLRLIARYAFLMLGLAVVAVGIGFVVRANAGLDSWTVLHMGLTRHVPLTLGQASELVGLLAIAVGWLLGVRPTLGTLLNMYFVGGFYDLFNQHGWLPATARQWPSQALYLALGTGLMALGSAWYMSANLGAGPRDSLMVALVHRSGWRVRTIRWSMEGSAIAAGFLLGGAVGVGTVISMLGLGQFLELWLLAFGWVERQAWSLGLVRVPVRRAAAR